MSQEPVRRTRTPSAVKWLANELAAVNGELERIDEELSRLAERRQRLLQVRESLSCVAAQLAVPQLPTVVPALRSQDRFGAKGALRNLMRQVLRAAYPQGVSTSTMADAVIQAFNLNVTGPRERERLIDNTIRSNLTKLHRQGEIEPLHQQGRQFGRAGLIAQSGVWRWKMVQPTWQELQQAAKRKTEAKDDRQEGSAIQEDEPWR